MSCHVTSCVVSCCVELCHVMSFCFFAVDGQWSSWSLWSVCSVTCGQGEQVRTRSCDNPSPDHGGDECGGQSEERRDCDTITCPGELHHSHLHRWTWVSQSLVQMSSILIYSGELHTNHSEWVQFSPVYSHLFSPVQPGHVSSMLTILGEVGSHQFNLTV